MLTYVSGYKPIAAFIDIIIIKSHIKNKIAEMRIEKIFHDATRYSLHSAAIMPYLIQYSGYEYRWCSIYYAADSVLMILYLTLINQIGK